MSHQMLRPFIVKVSVLGYSPKQFFVGFMVSEIPRVSVFGYFPLLISLTYVLLYALI